MDIDPSESSNWLNDYGFGISFTGDDIPLTASGGFSWVPQTFIGSSNMSKDAKEVEYSLKNSTVLENNPSKRLRSESCTFGSKACREKMRRDRINDRFLELSSILEHGGLPKTDKAAILSDAVRMVTQFRNEAQKLKNTNDELLIKIKELKAEKNELRDEKNKLKANKEQLEKQVKAMNAMPNFSPQPSAASRAFAVQRKAASHKLIPCIGYPGIAMWQYMPPAAFDTSKDHLLRPPVA